MSQSPVKKPNFKTEINVYSRVKKNGLGNFTVPDNYTTIRIICLFKIKNVICGYIFVTQPLPQSHSFLTSLNQKCPHKFYHETWCLDVLPNRFLIHVEC